MASPLQFRHVLCCDSVRIENNGKEMIIGAYSGGLVVQKFPANLPGLVFRAEAHIRSSVHTDFSCSIVDEKGKPLGTLKGRLDIDKLPSKGEIGVMHLPVGPLTFGEPGKYKVRFKLGNERSRDIFNFFVRISQPGDYGYQEPAPREGQTARLPQVGNQQAKPAGDRPGRSKRRVGVSRTR